VVAKLEGLKKGVDKRSVDEALRHYTRAEHLEVDAQSGACFVRFLNEEHFKAFEVKVKTGKVQLSLVNQGVQRVALKEEESKAQDVSLKVVKVQGKELKEYFVRAEKDKAEYHSYLERVRKYKQKKKAEM